jgi:hypothetical protein
MERKRARFIPRNLKIKPLVRIFSGSPVLLITRRLIHMTAKRPGILLFLFIFVITTGSVAAQEYQLDWEQSKGVTPKRSLDYTLGWGSVDEHVVRSVSEPEPEMVEPMVVAAQPNIVLAPPEPEPREVRRVYTPSRMVELNANQYYDHYAQKYLLVREVEVVVFKGGGSYTSEVWENRARYRSYAVYLNDLKPGDRYQVRIIWDDGSNRTIEETIDRNSYSTVVVDQPDYLASSAYW